MIKCLSDEDTRQGENLLHSSWLGGGGGGTPWCATCPICAVIISFRIKHGTTFSLNHSCRMNMHSLLLSWAMARLHIILNTSINPNGTNTNGTGVPYCQGRLKSSVTFIVKEIHMIYYVAILPHSTTTCPHSSSS
jgi:hypothetical protein